MFSLTPRHQRNIVIGFFLVMILLSGLALRLWLSPHRGSPGDLNINQNWMRSAVEFGFIESFRTQVDGNMWPNHGPVAIGLYAMAEYAYRFIVAPTGEVLQPAHMIYSKLSAIVFDLLLALMLFLFMLRLYDWKIGLLAAGIVAVHPVLILESALWGQSDVIYSFFTLLSLYLISRSSNISTGIGGIAYALAVLHKPHALIFAPLLLFILLPKWRSLLLFAGAGLLAAGIALLPFWLAGHPDSILRIYLNAPNEAWRLSWRAYNAWWMLFGDNAWERNGLEPFLFGLSYRTIGLTLFAAAYAFVLLVMRRILWSDERFVPSCIAAAAIALSFFLWNAGMHERYMFSFVVVGLPMLWAGIRLRALYIWITTLHYANLAVVLPLISVEGKLLALFPTLPVLIGTQLIIAFFFLMHTLWTDNRQLENQSPLWQYLRHTLHSAFLFLRRHCHACPMNKLTFITIVRTSMQSWSRQNVELGILILILCLGAWVRIHHFGAIPPGLNQDEATAGYDAYSLLHYGIERNGFRFPTHLIAWGSGQYPLLTYLSIPFMYLFGLNIVTTRIVVLLINLLALPIFFIVVRTIADRKTALLATFLLSISPWHIMLSRWGLDCNLFPAFFLFAVATLLRSLTRPGYLYAAAAFFALCLYAYGTAYLVVPIFLILSVPLLDVHRKIPMYTLLWSALLFLVISLPATLYVAINRFAWQSIETPFFTIPRLLTQPRFEEASTLFSNNVFAHVGNNLRIFWQVISTQSDGLIWNAIPTYGIFYTIGLPFIAIGLIVSIGNLYPRIKSNNSIIMLAWLGVSILLAMFMPVNINRINIIFLPLFYFFASGILSASRTRGVLATLILIHLLFFVGFQRYYFGPYRQEASETFFASLDQAIDYASKQTNETICVTEAINMPYIFVLFYERISPVVFLDTVVYSNGGKSGWVRSFDRYVFGLDHCDSRMVGATILHNNEISRFQNGPYHLETFELYTVAVPLLQSGGG